MIWAFGYLVISCIIAWGVDNIPWRGRVMIGLLWLPMLLLVIGLLSYDVVSDWLEDDE
jgi:hypothetical protein